MAQGPYRLDAPNPPHWTPRNPGPTFVPLDTTPPDTHRWMVGYVQGLVVGVVIGVVVVLAYLKWFPPVGNPICL